MSNIRKESYEKLLNFAQSDPRIMGLLLGGSRGKHFETSFSDYDIYVITENNAIDSIKNLFNMPLTTHQIEYDHNDLLLFSYTEFEQYAEFGTKFDYDAYNFAYNQAIIDKKGVIQPLITRKGTLTSQNARKLIGLDIDPYYNFYYRAIKCARDNNRFGLRIETMIALPMAINILFHLHQRIAPYGKYIEWELTHHPLEHVPWSGVKLLEKLNRIIDTSDIQIQHEIFLVIDKLLIDKGFKAQIQEWGDYSLKSMRTLKWE